MARHHVVLHPEEIQDLHRGPEGRRSSELYLRAGDSESEECWPRQVSGPAPVGVLGGGERPGDRRVFPAPVHHHGRTEGVAGQKPARRDR